MKPILFNTDMVRDILSGKKTVTRRVVKRPEELAYKPPYQSGDVLYVRETWAVHVCNDRLPPSIPCKKTAIGRDCYIYLADAASGKTPCGVWPSPHKWRPSIHMPKDAARIFLRVTGVRVERLQNIKKEDVIKEGVAPKWLRVEGCKCTWAVDGCLEKPCANRDAYEEMCYTEPFAELWNSTIKPADRDRYGWTANPWVWVIGFERISREETQNEKG